MSLAGGLVLRTNRYPHIHLFGERNLDAILDRILPRRAAGPAGVAVAPPARWAAAHGFIAGFGFGGFSLYVNTVAAPAMKVPWLCFLPGLVFGLGTMVTPVVVSGLFGLLQRLCSSLTAGDVGRVKSWCCSSSPLSFLPSYIPGNRSPMRELDRQDVNGSEQGTSTEYPCRRCGGNASAAFSRKSFCTRPHPVYRSGLVFMLFSMMYIAGAMEEAHHGRLMKNGREWPESLAQTFHPVKKRGLPQILRPPLRDDDVGDGVIACNGTGG